MIRSEVTGSAIGLYGPIRDNIVSLYFPSMRDIFRLSISMLERSWFYLDNRRTWGGTIFPKKTAIGCTVSYDPSLSRKGKVAI